MAGGMPHPRPTGNSRREMEVLDPEMENGMKTPARVSEE